MNKRKYLIQITDPGNKKFVRVRGRIGNDIEHSHIATGEVGLASHKLFRPLTKREYTELCVLLV